jgi:hypothetical protein
MRRIIKIEKFLKYYSKRYVILANFVKNIFLAIGDAFNKVTSLIIQIRDNLEIGE